jgi:hypothetical protein
MKKLPLSYQLLYQLNAVSKKEEMGKLRAAVWTLKYLFYSSHSISVGGGGEIYGHAVDWICEYPLTREVNSEFFGDLAD